MKVTQRKETGIAREVTDVEMTRRWQFRRRTDSLTPRKPAEPVPGGGDAYSAVTGRGLMKKGTQQRTVI